MHQPPTTILFWNPAAPAGPLPRPAGVRARQERVPFVCCEDEALLAAEAQPLLGKRVLLKAGTEGATLELGEAPFLNFFSPGCLPS